MNEPEANEDRAGRFQLSLKTLFLLLFCTSTWFAHWQYEMRTVVSVNMRTFDFDGLSVNCFR